MKSYAIPTPCDEDWSEMSPTQRGAFCQKCQLEVIDFTEKSNEEIRRIFLENKAEQLCVKIENQQLELLNSAYIEWDSQTISTFRSKFLWACLLTFSSFLFSGCQENVKAEEKPAKVSVIDSTRQNGTYVLETKLGKLNRPPYLKEELQSHKLSNPIKGRLESY